MHNPPIIIRPVRREDEPALLLLEKASFSSDRLSKRRMRHWIQADNRLFLVATRNNILLAYCLILLHNGTRLARLYSIAVAEAARGQGVGQSLLSEAEEQAADLGRLFMRLEVARNNTSAIVLYERMGYVTFGSIHDYYEDHEDALRMQKRIRYIPANLLTRETPWFQQTTDFSCGPAALMMAMASLDRSRAMTQIEELTLWRESTTIFMTSGHGGCHPAGLALAAARRGYRAEVYTNQKQAAFVEGVRNPQKRAILELVDHDYWVQAHMAGITIQRSEIRQEHIAAHLNSQGAIIMLISTYRMDGKKAPHWVTVTGMDDQCIYVHDPDPTDAVQIEIDCQHIPIARADFEKMSGFGRQRLRTAVLISLP